MIRASIPIVCVLALCSCVEVTLEDEEDIVQSWDAWPVQDTTLPDDAITDSTPLDMTAVDTAPTNDAADPNWIACETHCDCPSGQDCINKRCVEGSMAIHCCEAPECPSGLSCWSQTGEQGICP